MNNKPKYRWELQGEGFGSISKGVEHFNSANALVERLKDLKNFDLPVWDSSAEGIVTIRRIKNEAS